MTRTKLILTLALLAFMPGCDGLLDIDLSRGGDGWEDAKKYGPTWVIGGSLQGDHVLWTGADSAQLVVRAISTTSCNSNGWANDQLFWRVDRPDGSGDNGSVAFGGTCEQTDPDTYRFTFDGSSEVLTATISDSIMTRQLPPKEAILSSTGGTGTRIPADVILPDSMPVVTYVLK